jgi:hypothetical protein
MRNLGIACLLTGLAGTPYLLTVQDVEAHRDIGADALEVLAILLALLIGGLTIFTTGFDRSVLQRRATATRQIVRAYVWTFRISLIATVAALAYRAVAAKLQEHNGGVEDAALLAVTVLFGWSVLCTWTLMTTLKIVSFSVTESTVEAT